MTQFDATSTADQVLEGVDLGGKRVLVTGVSPGGMGLEIARALVARGADVVGTGRDMRKAKASIDQVRAAHPDGGTLEMIELDLASLASVERCASMLLDRDDRLNAIIANAGVMAGPKRLTADGYELQFGTNHLGHLALLDRLAPSLPGGSRVACVSSAGHRRSDIDLNDLNFETTQYDELLAYGRSKTAVILLAVELDRRYRERGVRAAALHPGAVLTDMVKQMIEDRKAAGNDPTASFEWKSVPQGAAVAVWTALVADQDEVGGRYCEDCRVADIDDDSTHASGVRSYALNLESAHALWLEGERMIAAVTP
jgi:NAD(P)-dependent dehydrogenase (short-subunit alcohol dehydrogenase family)